jgi:Tfp pilus assembly protein PilN
MASVKNKRPGAVLGLSFDGNRLEGVVLRRTNGSAVIDAEVVAPLSLNPLSHDPELAGREIREVLANAGIRERRCVVCLPLGWTLSLSLEYPTLPEEDVASFLQIEAERGFSTDPATLQLASSRVPLPGGGREHALQIGIPLEHLVRLDAVLRAARLLPVEFSLALPALQGPLPPAGGAAVIEVQEGTLGLGIIGGGGLLSLRTLDVAFEEDGAERRINAGTVARELRITLGQVPAELRATVKQVRIFGAGGLAERLAEELRPRVASLGIEVQQVLQALPGDLGYTLPPGACTRGCLLLAARHLAGQSPLLDFLPPRVTAWQRLTAKYSAKKLVYAGAAVGLALLFVGGAFFVQQVELSGLRRHWTAMSPRVRELETLQQEIKQFRPWFDDSFRTLSILRRLTETFPEEGSVTAKSIEIREASSITCTGVARDSQALYKVLDQLRAAADVSEVQVDTVRGKTPLQFSFNFHWGERSQP